MAVTPVIRSRLHSHGPAAAVTLLAGAVMAFAGYLFHTRGWSIAGPSTTPAGPLISVAFLLARRSSRPAGPVPGRQRLRSIALVVAGMPSTGSGVPTAVSLLITLTSVAAGAVMAVAGYSLAAWSPLPVPPLLLVAGVVITVPFVLLERIDKGRREI